MYSIYVYVSVGNFFRVVSIYNDSIRLFDKSTPPTPTSLLQNEKARDKHLYVMIHPDTNIFISFLGKFRPILRWMEGT